MSTAQRPSGRRYSMGAHGHSETSERFGNFLLQSGAGGEVWKPSYNGGPTTIRIFPGKNPDNPTEWDPFRISSEPRFFGDWVRRFPAVRSMGDPGCTFIIKDPGDDSISLEMTPAWVLYNAVNRAVSAKSDPGWGGYLKGGANRGAQLPRPGEVYLVQCCIVQHKGKIKSPFYGATDDKLVIMELGNSAGKALLDLCDALTEGYTGPPEDYNAMFQSGDIVDPQNGRYVTFYALKDGDPRQQRQSVQMTAAAAFGQGGRQGGGGGQNEDIGFGCYTEPNFGQIGASIAPVEEVIKRKVRLWDDILRFPTLEEQAAILASRFQPQMIMYAWQEFPDWIPEGTRAKAVGQVNVAMGGYGMPQGPQGMPGGYAAPAGQAAGFGAPQQGFGAQAGGFAAQQQPAPGFGQGGPQLGAGQAGFGAQQQPTQQQQPQQTNPQAAAGFGQPAAGFGAPAGAPQQQPPVQNPGAQAAGFGAPQQGFGAQQGFGGAVDGSMPQGGIPQTAGAPFDTNQAAQGTQPTAQQPSMQPPAEQAPGGGSVAQNALARARQAANRS